MSHYFPAVKPSQPSTRLGRPKGSHNKAPESVRWGLVEAYRQLGGVEGLVKWGKKPSNRGEFYKLLVKVIPVEMAEAGLSQDNKIQVVVLPAQSSSSPSARTVQPVVSIADAGVGTGHAKRGTDRAGAGDAVVQTDCTGDTGGSFGQAGGHEREPVA